jgi:hypothetical protein
MPAAAAAVESPLPSYVGIREFETGWRHTYSYSAAKIFNVEDAQQCVCSREADDDRVRLIVNRR